MFPKNFNEPMGAPAILEKQIEIKLLHPAFTLESRIQVTSYDIEAHSPDDFLLHQLDLHKGAVIASLRECRERLKKPPKTVDEYLETLESQGLIKFVAAIQEFKESL
ncbi:MAG: hypothetical protein P8X74_19620 [Reinekea sp.]